MGLMADVVGACETALDALGIPNAHDPGQARPKCVMIELPELRVETLKVVDVTIRLVVCGSPPGNKATNKWIADTVDEIIDSPLQVVDGRPSWADYGGQQLPTYELTARIGHHNT
jgi:hypothetical protein